MESDLGKVAKTILENIKIIDKKILNWFKGKKLLEISKLFDNKKK